MTTQRTHQEFVDRLDRHRAILFKVSAAYCRNAADREDLAGEIVVQLWRAYARFDGRSLFSTWMYRIAVNVAISFARSEARKRRGLADGDCLIEEIVAPQEAQSDAPLSLVRELINRFDPLNRALMLLYLDDYRYSEIAAILGITETNVATKIGRIKERLKRTVASDTPH